MVFLSVHEVIPMHDEVPMHDGVPMHDEAQKRSFYDVKYTDLL